MTAEKTLSERKDYYSMKRMATQDIMVWCDQKVPEHIMLRKLIIKYGFGELFLEKTLKNFGKKE
tara:strand:- start:2479 stop:2670 length:192 start_codon:yes stop_codon:yes gene_type:complete